MGVAKTRTAATSPRNGRTDESALGGAGGAASAGATAAATWFKLTGDRLPGLLLKILARGLCASDAGIRNWASPPPPPPPPPP